MGRFLICFLCILSSIESNNDWWRYNKMYELVVPSFKDSDDDGMGDLKGIISKLDYLKELSFDSVWLTPFFRTPMADMGYDISDYVGIDPQFGTMKDLQKLVRQFKKRNIKLIIDLVINHSSYEHPWFIKSVNRTKPYDDYYIWKDPKGYTADGQPIEPNNWMSIFGGSIWTWNGYRRQYYLHQFGVTQPDLNLRNKHVKNEIKNIMKFWFRKGVSGFRLDAPLFYMEDPLFRDFQSNGEERTYGLWESYEFVHELRTYVDKMNKKMKGPERILISEIYSDINGTMAMYGTTDHQMAHYPLGYFLKEIFSFFDSHDMRIRFDWWYGALPKGAVMMWATDNHDNERISSKFVPEHVDIINIFMMLLPGSACVYYGQEIGMKNAARRHDRMKDFYHYRDPYRSPMQWDDSVNAGFMNDSTPWVQIGPNYWEINVKNQKKERRSHYEVFQNASALRKTDTCKYGSVNFYEINSWVFGFTRTLKGHETYVVLVNMGAELEIVHLHGQIPHLPLTLEVVLASGNSEHESGDLIQPTVKFGSVRVFPMRPLSVIVMKSRKE